MKKKILVVILNDVIDTVGGAITSFNNFTNMLIENGYDVCAGFSKKKTDLAWMDSFKENRNVTELTRELVVTLIDRIEVSADKSIEITFRFKDEFKQLKECVDKLKEDMAG